jgi:hypothetical protein
MVSNASNGFNMEMMQNGLKLRKAMMVFCFHKHSTFGNINTIHPSNGSVEF